MPSFAEYPIPSGTVALVGAGQLASAIAAANTGDRLVVSGAQAGVIDITKPLEIVNGGAGTLEQITIDDSPDVWVTGFLFERTTPVTSNDFYAIEIEGAIRPRISGNEIRGHGYNVGIEVNRRFASTDGMIDGNKIHDIENRGMTIVGTGYHVTGNEITNLYRTTNLGFFDVDGINFAGSNHRFENNWIHDLIESDSLSTDNGGTDQVPHTDAFQTYTIMQADGVTPWITDRTVIRGNIVHNVTRQSVILESNDPVGNPSLVTNTMIVDNLFHGVEDGQVINLKGPNRVLVAGNTIVLEATTDGFTGIRLSDGGNSGATGDNLVWANNDFYLGEASDSQVNGNTGNATDRGGNTVTIGLPSFGTEWTAPDLTGPEHVALELGRSIPVGLSNASALTSHPSGSTLNISTPTILVNYDVGRINFNAGSEGSIVYNCRASGADLYNIVLSSALDDLDIRFENVYAENTRWTSIRKAGTTVVGGGGDWYGCDLDGGDDVMQIQNGNGSRLTRCRVAEQDYTSPDHSDGVQITGAGGYFDVYESVVGCRWGTSNGPFQVYTSLLTQDCIVENSYVNGGNYSFMGSNDGGPYTIRSRNNYFAWKSTQFGVQSVGTDTGSVWVSRRWHPRIAGAGGSYTPLGEGSNFPGHLAPVADNPWESTGESSGPGPGLQKISVATGLLDGLSATAVGGSISGARAAAALGGLTAQVNVGLPALRETVPANDPNAVSTVGAPRLWCDPAEGRNAPVRWRQDDRATPIYIPPPLRIIRPADTAALINALRAANLRPGDHIYLQPGVTYSGDNNIEVGGLDVATRVVVRQEPGTEWWRTDGGNPATVTVEGFDSLAVSHLMILHCKIHDITNGTGIGLIGKDSVDAGPLAGQDPATDITIYGNWIRNTQGSAITVRGTGGQDNPGDYNNMNGDIVIASNLVERAVTGSNECITVASGVTAVRVDENIVRDAAPGVGREGIDFKNGVKDGKIRRNIVYDLHQRCIYLDGGDFGSHPNATQLPVLENIEVSGNYCIGGANDPTNSGGTCLNINAEGAGNIDGVKVFNNIFTDTDDQASGSGYHGINVWKVTDSASNPGGDQSTIFRGIEIRHNTVANAHAIGINMSHPDATDTIIEGNLVIGSGSEHDIFVTTEPGVARPSSKNLARPSNGDTYDSAPPITLTQPGATTDNELLYEPDADTEPPLPLDYRPLYLLTDFHGQLRQGSWDYGAVEHVGVPVIDPPVEIGRPSRIMFAGRGLVGVDLIGGGPAPVGTDVGGTAAGLLGGLSASAIGGSTTVGTAAAALGGLAGAAAGTSGIEGTASASLSALSADVVGTRMPSGTAAAALGGLTAAATGSLTATGTAVFSSALTASAAGSRSTDGTAASQLGGLTGTVAGDGITVGIATGLLAGLTATSSGIVTRTGATSATLGGLTGSATGALTTTGTFAANLAGLGAAAAGTRTVDGSMLAELAGLTATATGIGAAVVTETKALVDGNTRPLIDITASTRPLVDIVGAAR